MKDAFISYSSKDSSWVSDVLLPSLEAHGFSVIIDSRDFKTGAFGLEEMERAVQETRRTLLVLTKNYVQSDWTKFENVMAQSKDPGAVQRKVIPILLEKCDLPLRLKILHYRDLTTNDPEQWDLLFRDLM
jgi:hypothetical protein